MEYALWLMILGTLLLLILGSALVFLYLQALKSLRLAATEQAAFLAKTTEIALQLTQNQQDAMESVLTAAQENLSTALSTATQELDRQQSLLQKSMDLTLTRALDGSNATQERIAALLQSAMTLLGTKDPIAYQQVLGSTLPQDSSGEPYTAVDDVAQQAAALDQAQILLERMGVVTTDGAGQPREYSGAAS